jgi:hypothetical protein
MMDKFLYNPEKINCGCSLTEAFSTCSIAVIPLKTSAEHIPLALAPAISDFKESPTINILDGSWKFFSGKSFFRNGNTHLYIGE